MSLTRLKAGAVVLLASYTMASLTTLGAAPPQDPAADAAARREQPPQVGGDNGVRSKGHLFTPDGTLLYVNVYSTDPGHNQDFPYSYAFVNVVPEIRRVRGVGTATILGNGGSTIRIRLNPEQMRAHDLSTDDIVDALSGCSMVGSPGWAVQATQQASQENVLTHVGGRYNKPAQYENIILKATPDGEILRLKDVGRVELGTPLFNFSSDVDGHPSAAIVLKQAPGSDAATVIAAIQERLEQIKNESFPPGMEVEVIPFDSRDAIFAVIETAGGSTPESTSASCHELAAIARGINEIGSVSSLVDYQIRTESGSSHAGTCLLHLKDRSDRKLTSRQIIETLEEKCRTMNAHLEFFEPPAVSTFVAAGGFSVRVLDKTNSNDKRPGSLPETSIADLLNRKDLASLFNFLASNHPRHELVIDHDAARRNGVSLASALENLAKADSGDVEAESKFRSLVKDLSHSFVKNDRGEMIPYSAFMQLTEKRGLNEIGR